jgi:glutathione peroxidase-family protein
MLPNCATSCHEIEQAEIRSLSELATVSSFFELSAHDIDGRLIDFDAYRGQVTIITNVASYCGYTDSHYKGLVELWSQVGGASVNILAFPCNQFGKQEPGTAEDIKEFAQERGVRFQMMQKVDVNGPAASLVYKFLKKQGGVDMIQWNFATYFVVAPDGTVTAHNDVEPMDLKPIALSLLQDEL